MALRAAPKAKRVVDDQPRSHPLVHAGIGPRGQNAQLRCHWAYRDDLSLYAVGRAVGVTHQTVQRCLARATRFGVMAALDDSPRPDKEPEITLEARAWLVSLACQKTKDVGYPHELWTTQSLARHARPHGGVLDGRSLHGTAGAG